MKANHMKGIPAVVLTEESLTSLLVAAGELAAKRTVELLENNLVQSPTDKKLLSLIGYIQDRTTIDNPRDHWAHGKHIKMINPPKSGKPRSDTWFHYFKQKTGLHDCFSRKSPEHGRLREWTFEDIAIAWDKYYALTFPTLNWDK